MKAFNLLSMAVIAILMVTAVGCTTVYEGYGDEPVSTRTRVRYEPLYGQEVYLARDPFTGRYYRTVRPQGAYDPYNSYDPYYNNRRYNRNSRYYDRNNNYPQYPQRGYQQRPPAQSQPAPAPQKSDKIEEARKRIRQ
jgi:hypothetical protein